MCIQMCKRTGQQDIVNEETNFSPQTAEDSSDTLTAGESTTNDETDQNQSPVLMSL